MGWHGGACPALEPIRLSATWRAVHAQCGLANRLLPETASAAQYLLPAAGKLRLDGVCTYILRTPYNTSRAAYIDPVIELNRDYVFCTVFAIEFYFLLLALLYCARRLLRGTAHLNPERKISGK